MNEMEYEQFKKFINDLLYEKTTLDDYELIMNKLGIPSPKKNNGVWMYKSLCHNIEVHKCKNNLAFYTDNRSFYCFSECQTSFNLITLLERRFELIGENKTRFQVVKWICEQLNIDFDFKEEIKKSNNHIYNWQNDLLKYQKSRSDKDLKVYDKKILNYFDEIYHISWINDNISIETMKKYSIKYYHYHDSIVIPCFNKDGDLIGIRERFLNPNSNAKYLPLTLLDGTQYAFPVNKTLYGLNYNNQNISHYKKVVLGEAEKFTMQCDTYFGYKNFSVSLYGKSISMEKVKQLIELGIEEVIIALDFDYKEVGDDDFEKFKKNVYRIGDYFKPYCKVSALVSYSGHNIKSSATDCGKEWYLKLFNNRENLYE